jgi:hypothetical protein
MVCSGIYSYAWNAILSERLILHCLFPLWLFPVATCNSWYVIFLCVYAVLYIYIYISSVLDAYLLTFCDVSFSRCFILSVFLSFFGVSWKLMRCVISFPLHCVLLFYVMFLFISSYLSDGVVCLVCWWSFSCPGAVCSAVK